MPIETHAQRLRRRRTKIVATLGPASRDATTVRALIESGVDVFRLNFSHGSHADHESAANVVREASEHLGRYVAILGDLCGPKIRAGRFEDGAIDLEEGEEVVVTVRDTPGRAGLIPTEYAALASDVKPGDRVLLDDGKLELEVLSTDGTDVRCRVVHGGTLTDRKGINLPGVNISTPSLTEKDREDARFALDLGVDFLALSFVRSGSDVHELRALAGDRTVGVVSKIEKPEALEDIDAILEASDAIMVARGDLGVELPPEVVPMAQSQLVERARKAGKPVIVATQMLESMVESARPTRAEVTDVSHAVESGADAVMLSAETAAGRHPVEAVEMMDRVAREAEGYAWRKGAFASLGRAPATEGPMDVRDAVSRAAGILSRDLMVRAIVVFSRSGRSARMVASGRPQAPVLAVSPDASVCRRMSLLWGVVPVQASLGDGTAPLHELARGVAREVKVAEHGQHILRVGGFHQDPAHNAPTIGILTV